MKMAIRAMDRKEKAVLITIGANLALVILKLFLSGASGSVALRASAWHSIGDVFSAGLVFAGYIAARILSGKKGRLVANIENGIALAISGLIFYMAFDIFREAASGGPVTDLRNIWPVTIASLVTIAITYFTARYKEYVGKATDSISLVASGYHSRLDFYASILVIVSLASSALGLGAIDRLVALVVCLLVAISGWEIASHAIGALMRGNESAGGASNPLVHARINGAIKAGVAILGVFTLLSGFTTIQPGESGVVRRFGRVVRDVQPGLAYRLPYIEKLDAVATGELRQARIGSTLVLTGDTNLVDVDMRVQYRVIDPRQFLFGVVQPAELVARIAEAAMREAVAIRKVDDLLVGSRAEIIESIEIKTQALLEANAAGIVVASVQLVSVAPPADVAEAFRDVASAKEDKNTYISEAIAYRNEILPAARGESAKAVLLAEAEMKRKVDASEGEAARFTLRVSAYGASPAVARDRLYIESMEKALPKARKFIVDPRVAGTQAQLWISRDAVSP